MDQTSLLDMIRRLLALSTSPNEHEAQAALAKAHELAAKYNLSLSEAQAAGGAAAGEYVSRDGAEFGTRMNYQQYLVAMILEGYYGVCALLATDRLTRRHRMIFFGRPHSVEIAMYVWDYLLATGSDLWRRQRRQFRLKVRHGKAFYQGLYSGIARRLREERAAMRQSDSTALAVIDADLRKQCEVQLGCAVARRGPASPSEHVPENQVAWIAGRQAAEQVRIRAGIEAGGQRSLPS